MIYRGDLRIEQAEADPAAGYAALVRDQSRRELLPVLQQLEGRFAQAGIPFEVEAAHYTLLNEAIVDIELMPVKGKHPGAIVTVINGIDGPQILYRDNFYTADEEGIDEVESRVRQDLKRDSEPTALPGLMTIAAARRARLKGEDLSSIAAPAAPASDAGQEKIRRRRGRGGIAFHS